MATSPAHHPRRLPPRRRVHSFTKARGLRDPKYASSWSRRWRESAAARLFSGRNDAMTRYFWSGTAAVSMRSTAASAWWRDRSILSVTDQRAVVGVLRRPAEEGPKKVQESRADPSAGA